MLNMLMHFTGAKFLSNALKATGDMAILSYVTCHIRGNFLGSYI